MAEQKRGGGAMLPLIIIGATLFGLGTYQSMRPQARGNSEPSEINQGFTAPPQNPRTIQAPDNPPIGKDAAQRAAEDSNATERSQAAEVSESKISISNAPWLQNIVTGAFGNFREGVLNNLKLEQAKGGINCSPVLTNLDQAAFANIEKVACTTKDGSQVEAEFDPIGEGEFSVEYPNGGRMQVSKNDGNFNVETRNSR